jgi:hypothetical protein
MAVVAISAFYMGIYRVLFDVDADVGRISFSWFLIFVAILSASTAWYGLRVLHFKNRKAPHRHPGDLIIPLALIASGIAPIAERSADESAAVADSDDRLGAGDCRLFPVLRSEVRQPDSQVTNPYLKNVP